MNNDIIAMGVCVTGFSVIIAALAGRVPEKEWTLGLMVTIPIFIGCIALSKKYCRDKVPILRK